eukprot:TRINITY_DN12525_c0_g1_i1.p1 TRINITY_DN12525_c0_g1~~TRINITY_DN12525_c0_g1_i1.p1  ORF type:complete len:343 (+),score=38.29 TRINITY_DN12525_c0_g1_i1:129-1031(+)
MALPAAPLRAISLSAAAGGAEAGTCFQPQQQQQWGVCVLPEFPPALEDDRDDDSEDLGGMQWERGVVMRVGSKPALSCGGEIIQFSYRAVWKVDGLRVLVRVGDQVEFLRQRKLTSSTCTRGVASEKAWKVRHVMTGAHVPDAATGELGVTGGPPLPVPEEAGNGNAGTLVDPHTGQRLIYNSGRHTPRAQSGSRRDRASAARAEVPRPAVSRPAPPSQAMPSPTAPMTLPAALPATMPVCAQAFPVPLPRAQTIFIPVSVWPGQVPASVSQVASLPPPMYVVPAQPAAHVSTPMIFGAE